MRFYQAGFMLLAVVSATLGSLVVPVQAQTKSDIHVFRDINEGGPSFDFHHSVSDLRRDGFNDRISSVVVNSGSWKLCTNISYGGRCITIGPGTYNNFKTQGLNDRVSSLKPVEVERGITVFRDVNEGGPSFDFRHSVPDLRRDGFNDRISSVVVHSGNWKLCTNIRYGGRCISIGPGTYNNFKNRRLNDRVSSLKSI